MNNSIHKVVIEAHTGATCVIRSFTLALSNNMSEITHNAIIDAAVDAFLLENSLEYQGLTIEGVYTG